VKPRTGDVVEVEWLDSEHIAIGWKHPREYVRAADVPQAYRSAGYLIDGTKDHVLIALSIDPANRTVTHCMSIPKVAVTATHVLGRGSRKVRKALDGRRHL